MKNNCFDFLGVSNVNLGILKAAFLTTNRDNVLYTDTLSKKEIAKYMNEISEKTRDEKISIIQEKMNKIYAGEIEDENELEREEAYVVLLLKSIPFTKEEADYYWKDRMEECKHEDTKNVLIEVAAIHPLIKGKPGVEFEEHLNQAIELYNYEKSKGNNPILYVPGSLHYVIDKEKNIPVVDEQPLSEAGKEYLIEKGIPEERIRANVINLDIKKDDGVYNSGDECYVATQLAKQEKCGRIISVVSPVQLYRKALFYQEFGYNPEMYATGSEKTLHNYIGETFWSLYITYMNDQDWQTGFLSYLTRKERNVEYQNTIKDYINIINDIISDGKKQTIPESVLENREEWKKAYDSAKANMDNALKNKKDIFIDLIRTDGKQDFELKRLEQLIKENSNAKITIHTVENRNLNDVMSISLKYPYVNVVRTKERNIEDISNMFKKGNYKKFFGMYPSSISMKQSVEFIEEGIVPIVSTLPEKESNYIGNISELFDKVLKPVRNKESKKDELEL